MCTLTWWRDAAGTCEVFFNRDEKKTRSVANPPGVHERDGISFIAPVDPDGGGTWMLANQRGLLVCLLNRWHEEGAAPQTMRSRGQLVMDMAALENVPAVEERLRMEELSGVRPFTMVGFDQVGERAWTWNGQTLSVGRPEMPMCSSSFHFEEVAAARKQRFHELRCSRRAGENLLEFFHADTDGGATAFTPRMLRSDAQTMSRSRVRVGSNGVRWIYLEEQSELEGEPQLFEAEI